MSAVTVARADTDTADPAGVGPGGSPSLPEHRRWERVHGLAIHTRCWPGPTGAQRTPAVVLHGLGVASRMCQPVAGRLARDRPVWAPDWAGFGHSEPPSRDLDIDGHADLLADWMGTIGVPAAVLVGVSLGSQVAAALAERYPARCARLVLGSPTVQADRRTWRQQVPRWQLEQATQSGRMRAIQLGDYARCGPRRALRTFAFALADRIEDRLPQVDAPVLTCWGTRDPLITRGWVEELAARAPDGRLAVLPGAVHALSHEHPLAFARVIEHFVDSRPAREQPADRRPPRRGAA
ncbi:alpha/beta hydrolase [Egibacter rhizosphaerae]|uniref:Alpha/beta hydrolase n=1 Tax=Egibacter rhizosphaerae TaxID=1670831 RepID=A0A411YB47_9ACTN|nr:alpha/beta hydrolase [Egibacter rhizosphaerae]QBI18402.1 alpha/beta hydrolase [Egibacter rhizosphaerae]